MKTILTSIKCWWLGHNWPPFEDAECERCGKVWSSGDASGASVRLWFWWHYHRPRWLKPWTLLKRCHDCGERFGKHTNNCPPF